MEKISLKKFYEQGRRVCCIATQNTAITGYPEALAQKGLDCPYRKAQAVRFPTKLLKDAESSECLHPNKSEPLIFFCAIEKALVNITL